jgi:hypothetical protein
VGDNEGRPVLDEAIDAGLDPSFGLAVDVTGRLVEDDDRRIVEQGPRDGDPLVLAAREFDSTLADPRVVAVGQFRDGLVGGRRFCSRDDAVALVRLAGPLGRKGVIATVRDVLGDGP